jgi:hypothetical protein
MCNGYILKTTGPSARILWKPKLISVSTKGGEFSDKLSDCYDLKRPLRPSGPLALTRCDLILISVELQSSLSVVPSESVIFLLWTMDESVVSCKLLKGEAFHYDNLNQVDE